MSIFREIEFWPFLEVRKNFKLSEHKHIIYHFEAGDLEMPNIQFVSRKIQISRFYESILEFREIHYCFYLREI